MIVLAGFVVVASSLCLIGLACVIFIRPAPAQRFLMSFASSAQAHYVEQAFRLLLGTSLVVLSPTMWQAPLFRLIGWAIVLASIVLLLMPWQWHNQFAKRVLPQLVKYMRLYATGAFAFGSLLLYAVFFGGSRGAP